MGVRKLIQNVKKVDAAIDGAVTRLVGAADKSTQGEKIRNPQSTKCQMPSRVGGNLCNRAKTSPSADTCGRSECAKAWAEIYDTKHSTHRHATRMRKID